MSVKNAILNTLMWLVVLAFPVQCVIDPSAENVASACILVVSALCMLAYLKWGGAADAQPLSTMAIFGFAITSQMGALLVQSAFWTPLRLSLYNPLLTFGTLACYQAIAILTHMVYRFFSLPDPRRVGITRGLFRWAGVYRVPSSGALWAMSVLGIVSFALSGREGIVSRIAAGFNFFAWAPFLLPLYMREIGPSYCNAWRNKLALAAYTVLIVLIGIALNVRIVMFIGVVTVALIYLLIGMRSRAPMKAKYLKQMGIVAVILLALSVPLSDLATSMAIARGVRGKVSPVEMVERTLAVWRRPQLIEEYRREGAAIARFAAYDEHYIANPILARFVETKFHDNAFHFAGALTTEESKDQLRKVTVDTIWATLPSPFLRLLHIGVQKEDINYSMGDYLAYLSRAVPLGSRKTGSMFAQGQAIMGPLFPILYAALCLFVYGILDLLTIRGGDGRVELSSLAMMNLWVFFYRGITAEALNNMFVFILRDFLQTVVIYVIIFAIVRAMLGNRPVRLESSIQPGWQRAT
jgi:hypothetical protein